MTDSLKVTVTFKAEVPVALYPPFTGIADETVGAVRSTRTEEALYGLAGPRLFNVSATELAERVVTTVPSPQPDMDSEYVVPLPVKESIRQEEAPVPEKVKSLVSSPEMADANVIE